jgi:pyruvate/2-oxoglutarate dehydrogenase complex dihydrolipoamide dehydrogenase (E3) component
MPDFDMIVIGAGSAGLSVTAGAAQLGVRVALIERDRMGGDCLNSGCVPSKALLAAAHAARAGREAGRLGVTFDPPRIDWDGVRAHIQRAIDTIAPMDSEERFRGLGATVLRGEARFVAPDAVSVDGSRLSARRIVIAAGSRAAVPQVPGLASVPFLTNATLFSLPVLPEHLLILGGGPVGLEMADAFNGLGARVTVVQSSRIAPREDPELVQPLRDLLRSRGIAIEEHATVTAVEPGPTLVLQDGRRISGSHLLVATGRVPNLEALDLANAGVIASARGVVTDTGLRSVSNRRVYAVGDIADPAGIGPRAFTHVGSYHAGIVIRRTLFRLPARIDYAALPRVTYTSPELAQVGMTEGEFRETGIAPKVVRWPLAENDRAVAEGETVGMIKVVMAHGRVVGASILAPHAGEMVGTWTLAVDQWVKASAIAAMILPYPTRAEIGKRAVSARFTHWLFSKGTRRLVRFLSWIGR